MYESQIASAITSGAYKVAGAESITLFISGSPSTTTIEGSNADGSTTALANTTADWSALSVVVAPAPDMIAITPGFGYLRCLRSETTSVILELIY